MDKNLWSKIGYCLASKLYLLRKFLPPKCPKGPKILRMFGPTKALQNYLTKKRVLVQEPKTETKKEKEYFQKICSRVILP